MDKQAVRVFCQEAVLTRIQDRAGTRYQSAQLAAYFGVPTARMTEILKLLVAARQVRVVRCGGSPTMYYLPSEAEKQAEARLMERAREPLSPVKVESDREKARRQLSFGLVEEKA